MFQALLKDIPVDYGVDYMEDKEKLDSLAKKVVYTGALDEFFGYDTGVLDWRSLRFEEERHEGNYQGVSVLNYTEEAVPYTRILEHKHFDFTQHDHTFITKEYPQDWKTGEEKFYPITSVKNNELHRRYKHRIDNEKFITGGRLADYKYYDMHQVVGSALAASEKEIR
jgi:UDP-galactopyranose mutase